MAVNNISSQIRLTGMVSGLDTDAIIRDLMKAERFPLDKAMQQKQLATWRRDEYRSITNLLNDFYRSMMDVSNPATNMRSQAQYKKFLVDVTNASGAATKALTASGTVNAATGTHKLIVKSLATAAKETSAAKISSVLQTDHIGGELALDGKSIQVTLDGVTKQITFRSDYSITDQASGDAFAGEFQALLTEAFGAGIEDGAKVTAAYDHASGKLSFQTGAGATKVSFHNAVENDALADLGMSNGASNRIQTSATLASLRHAFGASGGLSFYDDNGTEKLKFTINNKEFTFTADTSLNTVMNTISNDTTANVNFSYDTVTDKFILTAKDTGAGSNIKITNTWGNFFGAASVTSIDPQADGFGANGTDAVVSIDGQNLSRSSNTFTENGVTYTLLTANPSEEITVNLSSDVNGIYNNIKGFIDQYNAVIDKIYSVVNAKPDKNYPPLTDTQKEDMSKEEIEKWETKAKEGLLRSDPILRKIVDTMRTQMVEAVEGTNISLFDIGISSQSHLDFGKLTVNEAKLKKAIQENPDGVMNLFSQQSSTHSLYDRKATAAERAVRFREEGLAQRLYDIVQDNISILMDSNGQKGYLLEKAGMTGDTTDLTSVLSKQIKNYTDSIDNWEKKLAAKEEIYYKKFTAMETALSKLSSQSAWIAAQLSSLNSY